MSKATPAAAKTLRDLRRITSRVTVYHTRQDLKLGAAEQITQFIGYSFPGAKGEIILGATTLTQILASIQSGEIVILVGEPLASEASRLTQIRVPLLYARLQITPTEDTVTSLWCITRGGEHIQVYDAQEGETLGERVQW